MQQVLLALGYSHLSEHVATLTHVNFATQLEAYGLWHWAIFVMLHLKDAGKRKTAVMNLLQRHVEIDEIADSLDPIEREKFLREELGIPSIWIHQAKAVKSYVAKRFVKVDPLSLIHILIVLVKEFCFFFFLFADTEKQLFILFKRNNGTKLTRLSLNI